MTKVDGGAARAKKVKTPETAQRHRAKLLPALPLPAPELCLLNSRPLSCLHGAQQERSHRHRLRQALRDSEFCAEGSDGSDGSAEEEEAPLTGKAAVAALRGELRLYEALLAYIGVRLASKRNAMEVLGIDMGSMQRGFGLLERAAAYGVPALPMQTLIKTLQLRRGGGRKRAASQMPLSPTDIGERLEDLEGLRDELKGLVAEVLDAHRPRDGGGSRVKRSSSRRSERRYELSLRGLWRLPLSDNAIFSLLAPSAVVEPDDEDSVDVWADVRVAYGVADSARATKAAKATKDAKDSKDSKDGKTATKAGKDTRVATAPKAANDSGKKQAAVAGNRASASATGSVKGGGKQQPKVDKRPPTRSERLRNRNNQALRSTTGGGQTAAKRRQAAADDSSSGGEDEDDTDDDADDSDYLDGCAARQHARKQPKPRPKIPEANMTEDQMLRNLLDGKLCDGSDPQDARELVISILAAGLYEFLPVEFFNDILMDQRLHDCFEQVGGDDPGGSPGGDPDQNE